MLWDISSQLFADPINLLSITNIKIAKECRFFADSAGEHSQVVHQFLRNTPSGVFPPPSPVV
jgi:hypothetical protein